MAAVLLAAVVACLPQRAAAGCGDYVVITDDHGTPMMPPGHDTHPADGRPAPCHGPNCDRAPAEPLAPPAVPVTTPHQPKQRLAGTDEPGDPGPSDWCGAPHTSGRAVRRPTSVFHPPRAA